MFARIASVVLLCSAALWAQALPSSADEILKEAVVSGTSGDLSKAEFWFKQLRAEFPEDVRGVSGLLRVLSLQNREQDARKLARENQAQFGSDPIFVFSTGEMLAKFERLPEALAEFQTALRLSKTAQMREGVYNQIGDLYRRMGALDDAVTAFRKAKEMSGRASLLLAFALNARGDTSEEMAEYRDVLRDDPAQPVALNNLAYTLAERNLNLDEALAMSLRAVDITHGSAVMMDTLGWVYFKKGMLEDAEATMIEALRLEGGTQDTLREHMVAVLDARALWTPDRRALRDLVDTGSTPDDLARMKVLLGKVRAR